jgi:hypothetical protein
MIEEASNVGDHVLLEDEGRRRKQERGHRRVYSFNRAFDLTNVTMGSKVQLYGKEGIGGTGKLVVNVNVGNVEATASIQADHQVTTRLRGVAHPTNVKKNVLIR